MATMGGARDKRVSRTNHMGEIKEMTKGGALYVYEAEDDILYLHSTYEHYVYVYTYCIYHHPFVHFCCQRANSLPVDLDAEMKRRT